MMGKYGRPEFESEFSIMFQDIKSISVQDFLGWYYRVFG